MIVPTFVQYVLLEFPQFTENPVNRFIKILSTCQLEINDPSQSIRQHVSKLGNFLVTRQPRPERNPVAYLSGTHPFAPIIGIYQWPLEMPLAAVPKSTMAVTHLNRVRAY